MTDCWFYLYPDAPDLFWALKQPDFETPTISGVCTRGSGSSTPGNYADLALIPQPGGRALP